MKPWCIQKAAPVSVPSLEFLQPAEALQGPETSQGTNYSALYAPAYCSKIKTQTEWAPSQMEAL